MNESRTILAFTPFVALLKRLLELTKLEFQKELVRCSQISIHCLFVSFGYCFISVARLART